MDLHRLGLELLRVRVIGLGLGLGLTFIASASSSFLAISAFIAFFRSREAWAGVGLGLALGLESLTDSLTESCLRQVALRIRPDLLLPRLLRLCCGADAVQQPTKGLVGGLGLGFGLESVKRSACTELLSASARCMVLTDRPTDRPTDRLTD